MKERKSLTADFFLILPARIKMKNIIFFEPSSTAEVSCIRKLPQEEC